MSVDKNEALSEYFRSLADQLTEEWYESVDDRDPSSVYASKIPAIIKNLKLQNNNFNQYVCNCFVMDEKEFFEGFDSWIMHNATDSDHVSTPIPYILREFMKVRQQYLDYLDRFLDQSDEEICREQASRWISKIIRVFDITIMKFVEVNHQTAEKQLVAQQEMINELSSPVITLKEGTALLPLVGDVDTARAKSILENTLLQCSERRVTHLFIDLSGVVMIDTMVANELFQLVKALRLIGVNCTLSGIRPEIAVTALQLGLSFDDLQVTATLSQAIMVNENKQEV